MSTVFLKMLNLSLTASWLILAVIIIRPLLRKAPKWITCALWGLVALRLICPFSLESALSLVPSNEPIPYDIALRTTPAIESGISAVNSVVNPVIAGSFTPDSTASVNPLQIVIEVVSAVWIVGVVVLLLYAWVVYIRLKRSVGASIVIRDNILACDEVKSPFILGIVRPVIYVPSSMNGETLEYVINHEISHLKRLDHWWKPFGYLLLTVYWFNPLCWVAYILLCRDIEIACDERVIRDMDRESKAAYSQALLNCSFSRKRIAVCPLAFGEVGVKTRVKSVLSYKKPAFWIICASIIACLIVAICFMTNPVHKIKDGGVTNNVLATQGISLEVIELTGNTLIIKLRNDSENDFNYDTHFVLQKEIAGEYCTYLPVEKDFFWEFGSGVLSAHSEVGLGINLYMYGQLEKGNYRIETMGLVSDFSVDDTEVDALNSTVLSAGNVRMSNIDSSVDEFSYTIEADLVRTDFGNVGQQVKDKLDKEWQTFDSMTLEQKMFSSHIFGMIYLEFDNWSEIQGILNVEHENPLEKIRWLTKTGYFGAESVDVRNPIKHIETTVYSDPSTREICEILTTSGYNTDGVKVTLSTVLTSESGVYKTGSVYAHTDYAAYSKQVATTKSGHSALIVNTNMKNTQGYYSDDFFEINAYWTDNNVFYNLRVFGSAKDREKIQATFDKIMTEI